MDWTIVAGAAGAVLGSGLTLGGVWLTARQRERADLRADAREQRTEWGRRLQFALGQLLSSADPRLRAIGRTLLESLTASSLATPEDRQLAAAMLALDLDGSGGDRHNEDNAGGAP